MDSLPLDLENIILDYKKQLENNDLKQEIINKLSIKKSQIISKIEYDWIWNCFGLFSTQYLKYLIKYYNTKMEYKRTHKLYVKYSGTRRDIKIRLNQILKRLEIIKRI